VIALFSGEPLDALWLTIMFTALQQIEGHIVAPTCSRRRCASTRCW
jgi:predicted PurR-regulated permease PerM